MKISPLDKELTDIISGDALDPEKDTDMDFIGEIAKRIVGIRMSVPAIFMLESVKPVTGIGQQFLVAFGPFITIIVPEKRFDRFIGLLEDRENVERLIMAIEDADDDERDRLRAEKKKLREERRVLAREKGGVRGFFMRYFG